MPYYAVHRGRRRGVYRTWENCKEQVEGFYRPSFKKFESLLDAKDFVEHGIVPTHKEPTENTVHTQGFSRPQTTETDSKAVYCIVYANDVSRNRSEKVTGPPENKYRADLEAIVDTIEENRDGEDVLFIKSASKYAINSLTIWSERWVQEGWTTHGNTPVKNQDIIKKGLRLIRERPSSVEFILVKRYGLQENKLAALMAELKLDED